MRIWDLNPGYLNRQSLLGEHRELHGIVAIISDNKKGYSKHPETLRWVGHGWALRQRHRLLATEMNLRGYTDRSPVTLRANPGNWPATFIDPPAGQVAILARKYRDLEPGRIPLPRNAQQLWAQHKYSVMARDNAAYKEMGKSVTTKIGAKAMDEVARDLVYLLQQPPAQRLIENSLLHMWGYVSEYVESPAHEIDGVSMPGLLRKIQQLAMVNRVSYLVESTAIGELAAWDIGQLNN